MIDLRDRRLDLNLMVSLDLVQATPSFMSTAQEPLDWKLLNGDHHLHSLCLDVNPSFCLLSLMSAHKLLSRFVSTLQNTSSLNESRARSVKATAGERHIVMAFRLFVFILKFE